MKNSITGKIISGLIFGIILGFLIHFEYAKRGLMGRDQYLAQQAAKFDLYFANPAPITHDLIFSLFVAAGLLIAYEAAALGITQILDVLDRRSGKAP
jgi:hypothetical protein